MRHATDFVLCVTHFKITQRKQKVSCRMKELLRELHGLNEVQFHIALHQVLHAIPSLQRAAFCVAAHSEREEDELNHEAWKIASTMIDSVEHEHGENVRVISLVLAALKMTDAILTRQHELLYEEESEKDNGKHENDSNTQNNGN